MATQATVQRLALALPGVCQNVGQWGFHVINAGKEKGLAWVWLERTDPKKARVPNPAVLAIRVENEDAKDALIAGAPETFFTEPHYNGYPAVLIRLAAIDDAALAKLLEDAWRIQAPKSLRDGGRATPKAQKTKRKATPKRATAKRKAKPRTQTKR